MRNAVEVSGLNKSCREFALRDVSFEIPTGYIMGFIGPNGAGKTTTIKAILNLINFESGSIRLFGQDSRDGAAEINEQVGVVMDTPLFPDEWTAADTERAAAPFYRQWDGGKYDDLLLRFKIEKKKKIKNLSRGMKVKLMIAAALSHNARLLVLDEPTSGLDPVARDEICDLLAGFVTDENRSVLFSTHITSDLEKIADYITFIMDGRIVFTGPKDDLLTRYMMVRGGRRDITPAHKEFIIGLREYSTGFEGLAEAGNVRKLPSVLMTEPVSLEDIIIYMNKERAYSDE
jgi:ABC-2 type transport system ATP-binding protein